ncbi:cyanate transporter [Serratia plymuthica]|uniref:Inner membrane transport protein YeaN n=2 Tax=Serratia plymuthica TaxID=82996 RepID=A0A2X4TPS8_SERPL|nr:CP family cyanate transporter-like MFS transporter [Serratia plymuthica]CAI2493714.1 Inner membrane transport protein YeaN [Serratia plymuthica]SQI29151.1 Inner membrane transport protein YeaN [Serratia plymuthica]
MLNHSVSPATPRHGFTPLLWALVLIGLNMRPLLTSVGPLLPTLRQATGLSFGGAALLTTLPVLMMGLMALAGGVINRLFSERTSVVLSLLAIGLGAAWRELAPGSTQLMLSAVLGGLGIGVIQAVMPGIIKHHFLRQMALVAGLWSAALMGGGGLGAAITPWLMSAGHDWHSALAWWAAPALVALIAWWPVSRGLARLAPSGATAGPNLLFSRRAWLLGAYFGLINGGYTSLIAWLPPYYMQLGWQPQASGTLLALMTFGQVIGALLLPAVARAQDRRPLLWLALALQLIGFIGLIYLPQTLPWLWVLIAGLGLGGAFPLCLVLALDHIPHPAAAGRLVAFMQGIGFLLAGVTPYLSGLLRDYSGGFTLDWQIHALLVVALIAITGRFHPRSYRQAFSE